MSTTFLQVTCHHSIVWSLMICLNLFSALAMMHCSMIFVTAFLTLIVTCNPWWWVHLWLTSFLPSASYWWSLAEGIWVLCPSSWLSQMTLISEDHEHVKWIDQTPQELPRQLPILIEQSDNESETSVHPPPVFVSGTIMDWWHYFENITCFSHLVNVQREHPPTYLLLKRMFLLPLIVPQLLIPTIMMNLILNIFAKANKNRNTNLAIYIEPTKFLVILNLNRFQFVPLDCLIWNSTANIAVIWRTSYKSPLQIHHLCCQWLEI